MKIQRIYNSDNNAPTAFEIIDSYIQEKIEKMVKDTLKVKG